MPFEVYTRSFVKTSAPKITISGFGRIALNKSAADALTKGGTGFIVLLWDKATNRIGIQPVAKESTNTYPLKSYGPSGKTGTGFSAVTFLNFIDYDWSETRSFAAEWSAKDKMLIFSIPQEHLAGHKGGPHPSRRQARIAVTPTEHKREIRLED
jgi:hypothetical protein